jgi:hypothetical protein
VIITLDLETYYDKEFSLSKMTTEEYVRHDGFEIIGVGVKVDEGETTWCSGTKGEIKKFLNQYRSKTWTTSSMWNTKSFM